VRPLDREITRLAVPALGALIAEPLYILADTAVVGHLGTPQLAGLAVASSVLLTAHALCTFLAYGTTASVARLLGAGDEREAAHQAVQGLWLAAGIGAALALLGWATAPALVDLLGAEGDVARHAELYLVVSLPGLPALLAVLAGTGYLRGLQDTRTPLVVAVASAALNLGLELLFVYGLGYGIGASAAMTVVAQWCAAAVYLRTIGRSARRLGVDLRPHVATLRRLLVVAGALVVRTTALRGALVLATAVAARIGTTDVGAHQVAYELWNTLALALDALAIAGQALVGRALGAGDADGARAVGRRLLELGVAGGLVAGAAVAASRTFLPEVFTDDAEVARLAAFVLWWVAALQPVNAIVFVLDGLLIGAGDLRYLAGAMAGAAVVFAACAGAVLTTGAGLGWLWAAIGAFMAARLVPLAVRWSGDRWAVVGHRR
jgi:putative MATE family efflux protein